MATGISGTTDIEVTDGLKEGDEIVTGSYKVLRTLRNGAGVKIDNTVKPKNGRIVGTLFAIRCSLFARKRW